MTTDRHQGYKWDDETKDDSPSEFSSTSFPASTGALHSAWSHERRKRRRAARRTSLMWGMLLAIGASAMLLYAVAGWLRPH